jgi:hypothetical protein
MKVIKRGVNLPAQRSVKSGSGDRMLSKSYGEIISLLVISACILTLLANCGPTSVLREPVPNKPETRVFDLKPSIVIKGVERVLKNKRFTLKAGRPDSRQLQTEWLRDGSYRSMVYVEVKPAGKGHSELTVHLILQKKKALKESWQPVDEIGRHIYDNFMDDVQIESYRVLYYGR